MPIKIITGLKSYDLRDNICNITCRHIFINRIIKRAIKALSCIYLTKDSFLKLSGSTMRRSSDFDALISGAQ
jgi:hypothetical protein